MAAPKSIFWCQEKAEGTPLISFEKGKLTVRNRGAGILKTLSKTTPSNLVFVFGSARSGKSFLMNSLTGVRGLFKVVNSSEPCTRGVDISSLVLPWNQLAGQFDGLEAQLAQESAARGLRPRPARVIFADCEGQGAEDGTYDTMLALPLLLTSKVCLYNHKGAPTVTDMLSRLGVLARAADYVQLADDEESAEGKDGDAKKSKFGHLHIIFRDFSFEGDRESVYNQLMGLEKVVKTLQKGPGLDASKAAQERNDIRQLLLNNFESIQVWLLPMPAGHEQLKANNELPEELISPDFMKEVRDLLKAVAQQTMLPTMFNGVHLHGPRLLSLVEKVCEALNEGGLVNVPSVYRAMERDTVLRIAAECWAAVNEVGENLRKDLPMSMDSLNKKLKAVILSQCEKYDTELFECTLKEDVATERKVWVDRAEALKQALATTNGELTATLVRDVVTDEMDKVKFAFKTWCDANLPVAEVKTLEDEFKKLKADGFKAIEVRLMHVEDATSTPTYKLAMDEGEATLLEHFQLQMVSNENKKKDRLIDSLRDEAINTQRALMEQSRKLEVYEDEAKARTKAMELKLAQLEADKNGEESKLAEFQLLLQAKEQEIAKLKGNKKQCIIL